MKKKAASIIWGYTQGKTPDELAEMLAELEEETRNGAAFVFLKVSECEQRPGKKPKTPSKRSRKHREKKTITPRPAPKLQPEGMKAREVMEGEGGTSPGAPIEPEAETWQEVTDAEGWRLALLVSDLGTEPRGWHRWKVSGDYTEEREEKGETDK